MKNNNKGFSLVELIVVIAIMAVLVGVLAPSLLRYVEKTRIQKDASAIAEVCEAIKISAAEESIYNELNAATAAERTVLVTKSSGAISSTKLPNLAADLSKTIGTITFSGKDAADVTITIVVDANGAITCNCAGGGSNDWSTAITKVH